MILPGAQSQQELRKFPTLHRSHSTKDLLVKAGTQGFSLAFLNRLWRQRVPMNNNLDQLLNSCFH
jgi:hypothetical protein